MERLLNYIKGSIPLTGEIQTCVSILNTVLNYKPRNNFAVIKRGVFPETENRPRYLYGGLELKTGFCQSMRPGWGKYFKKFFFFFGKKIFFTIMNSNFY